MIGALITLCLCTCVDLVVGDVSPHHLCDEIATVDCSNNYAPTETDERVCGSDGVTYNNFCEYSQARCKTPTTHIAKIGDCSATTTLPTTTMPTTTIPTTTLSTLVPTGVTGTTAFRSTVVTTTATTSGTTTVDTVLQVFCAAKDSIDCGTKLEPVCGSDKNFYLNQCDFTKSRCDTAGLSSRPISFCTGAGR